MANQEDMLYGRTAITMGIISPTQLAECLKLQEEWSKQGQKLSILNVFTRQGLINQEQVQQIHSSASGQTTAKDVSSSLKPTQMNAQTQFGRYRIVDEIGRGGMGQVYKVHDPQLNRLVALKVLVSTGGETDVQRFLREAQATAALKHPNIVSVYDIGEEMGKNFFTMDFIAGSSLQEALKSRIPIRQLVQIMQKVGEAIDYAHKQGVIHRDLKPANIMLTNNKEPLVMDFGLAKLTKESAKLSKSGMLMGTVQYMPPEQAEGKHREIDARSDVYSLGAILYEMLTNTPPFTGTSFTNVLHQVINEDPKPPTKLKPRTPAALESICLKALEKKKEKRYQSAGEFVDDLERFMAKKSVKASSQMATRKISQHLQKLKYIAILIAILSVGFVFGKITSKDSTPASTKKSLSKKQISSQSQKVSQKVSLQSQKIIKSDKMPDIALFADDPKLGAIYSIATDGNYIYIGSIKKFKGIWKIPIDGKKPTLLYKNPGGSPRGLTLMGKYIFWMDPGSGPKTDTQIFRASKNGMGKAMAIYTGTLVSKPFPQPILDGSDLTSDGRSLFCVDMVHGRVYTLSTDAKNIQFIVGDRYMGGFKTSHNNFIAYDHNALYIADAGGKGFKPKIIKVSGRDIKNLHTGAPLVSPIDIVVAKQVIYICDTGVIWRLTTKDSVPKVFFKGKPLSHPIKMAYAKGHLYIASAIREGKKALDKIYRIAIAKE